MRLFFQGGDAVGDTYTFIAYFGNQEGLAQAETRLMELEQDFPVSFSGSSNYFDYRPCQHWLFDHTRILKSIEKPGRYHELLEKILALPNFAMGASCPVCSKSTRQAKA
jgi:hypothetical protein